MASIYPGPATSAPPAGTANVEVVDLTVEEEENDGRSSRLERVCINPLASINFVTDIIAER
jgi:hypothetical protein